MPLLLSEPAQAAHDILALVGECGNAKEVIIATQEAVERIKAISSSDIADDVVTLPSQVVRLIDLHASCNTKWILSSEDVLTHFTGIPRVKTQKKPPSQTLQLWLSDLQASIYSVGRQATQTEGREMISHVSHLIQRVASWTKTFAGGQPDEISRCNVRLLLWSNLPFYFWIKCRTS